jgi:pimeloyl-ACP methyl ester carboxylesterase
MRSRVDSARRLAALAAALAIAALGAAAVLRAARAGEDQYPYVPPAPPPCDLAALGVMVTGDILLGDPPKKCYPGGFCVDDPLDYTDDLLRGVFRAWWAQASPEDRQYLVDLAAGIAAPVHDQTSAASVRDVAPPAAFAGEEVASAAKIDGLTFDERTWLVEFRLPPHPDALSPAGIAPGLVARRGWLTRGSGFTVGARFHHPLIIIGLGLGEQFTSVDDVQARHELFRLANEARCDLLCVDNRGHGISDGTNQLDNGAMAEDVFDMLDALETGANLTVIPPGDRTRVLEGASLARRLPLLPGRSAKTTEVILDGGSMGEITSAIAMSKNFPAVGRGRGYDFKGMIGWSGHSGGYFFANPRFVDPVLDFIYVAGYLRQVGHITFGPDASVAASVPRWPALLEVGKGLKDEITGPDNTVYLYNRARGLKGIHLVPGPHDWEDYPACPGGAFDYMVDREVEFIPQMVERAAHAPPDETTTTLEAEACAYPKASPPPKECP